MEKPEYITNIEKTEGVYSVTTLELKLKNIDKIDNNKNLETVYIKGIFSDNKYQMEKKLYKTSGGFYIYLEETYQLQDWKEYSLSVYHKPENLKEILIFLMQLNKK
jgi:hypothetical protein